MSEIDVMLREQLDGLVPVYGPPDWGAVLTRAGCRDRWLRRRWVLVAAVVAAVAVIVGVAVAAALGGFSSWLHGQPGVPASRSEQRAFARANAHSFLGFPPGTQLRQLLRNEQGGVRVDLLGFRAGSTLCLRVAVSGSPRGSTQSCAPLAELRRAGPPVRVVLADAGFGRGTKAVWYGLDRVHSQALQVTAGIVADGVRSVTVQDDSGRHRLPVKSNAFLYVARNPAVGQRVRRIWASQGGRLVPIPFAPAPFGFGGREPRKLPANAPTRVERHVVSGTISWLDRREPRGQPLDVLPARMRSVVKRHAVFGRVIAPDPGRPLRVAVTLSTSRNGTEPIGVCTWQITRSGGGGGCARRAQLFSQGPITLGTFQQKGSDEFVTASGLASDDVVRIAAYLANGQRVAVPLADNVYVVDLPRAELPARLVAYDRKGRVIGLTDSVSDFGARLGSPAPGKAKPLLRVASPTGATAQLLVGKSTAGGTCMYVRWYVSKYVQGVMVNCADFSRPGSPLQLGTNGPQFVMGRVYRTVASVQLRYADGDRTTIEPTRTFVLYAVPQRHLAKGHELVAAVALNSNGKAIGTQSFKPPKREGSG